MLPVTHSHAGASLSGLQAALKTAAEMVLVGSLQAEQGGGGRGRNVLFLAGGCLVFAARTILSKASPCSTGWAWVSVLLL